MAAPTRCVFLAGAPEADQLKWDEEGLFTGFKLPIRRFLDDNATHASQASTQGTPPPSFAKWRSISLDDEAFPDPDIEMTQFLSFEGNGLEVRKQDFLERSMAMLDDIDPNHIVPRATVQDADGDSFLGTTFLSNTSFTSTSFDTTSLGTSAGSFPIPSTESVAMSGPITDLKRIPNADYITRIQPQTITVNLVVGIIAISTTRTVRLRRRNAEMDIIDVTVGDETRAGFNISFWLVPLDSQHKSADDLRKVLGKLKTGDVVLLKNVALACWKGCVFGQSLSRRFARNSTSVSVLGDGEEGTKVERVREWTSDFVGVAPRTKANKSAPVAGIDVLPPDTQD